MIGVWLGPLLSSIFVSRKFRRRLKQPVTRAVVGSYFVRVRGENISGGSLVAGVRLVLRFPVTAAGFRTSQPTPGVRFLFDLFQLLPLLRCQLRCQGAVGLRNHL